MTGLKLKEECDFVMMMLRSVDDDRRSRILPRYKSNIYIIISVSGQERGTTTQIRSNPDETSIGKMVV
jgi:hypothetical protein